MRLSNKKTKYIKRHAETRTVKQIARDLKISARDVERELKRLALQQESADTGGESEQNEVIDEIFFWIVVLFVAVAPFVHVDQTYDFANLPQAIFVQCGVLLAMFLWFLKSSIRSEPTFRWTPFALPLFVFVGWALLSLVWAVNRWEGLTTWMHWTACALAMLLVGNALKTRDDPFRFLLIVFLSGLFIAVLGIFQHLMDVKWVPQVIPPAATFANRNMAVHYIILTMPLGAGLFFRSTRPYLSWLFALLTGVMLLFLLYTDNRTGLLAFGVEFLVACGLLLALRKTGATTMAWDRHKTGAFVASLILVLVFFNLTPRGFEWRTGDMYNRVNDAFFSFFQAESMKPEDLERDLAETGAEIGVDNPAGAVPDPRLAGKRSVDPSGKLRKAIFLNTMEMIKDRPLLGYGLGNHKVYYPLYVRKKVVEEVFSEDAQLTNVHNDHLQAASELGLVGYAMLVWLAVVVVLVTVVLFRKGGSLERDRFLVLAMVVAACGLMVNAMFSFPFQRSIPPLTFLSYLGVLGFMYERKQGREPKRFPRPLGPALCIAAGLGFILLLRVEMRWLKADRRYLMMTSAEKQGWWGTVIREGERTLALNPHRAKVYSYLGRAYVESNMPEQGIEALKQVIDAYPNHMNALLNLGVAYGNTQQYDKALETYEKVVDIKPDYGKAHNNIANVYMRQQQFEKALREFSLAAKYDPENAVVRFNAGIVALKLEKYEKAAVEFAKAAEIRPEWAAAHRNLGAVLHHYLNRKEEALEHIRTARELEAAQKRAEHRDRRPVPEPGRPRMPVPMPDGSLTRTR
ncbi:MAG: tetratricopeptide repeat protein [Desulfatibacillaceae bacterium]